jgi:hypothetical protein
MDVVQVPPIAFELVLLQQQVLEELIGEVVRPEAELLADEAVRLQLLKLLQGVHHHHPLQLGQQPMDVLCVLVAVQDQDHLEKTSQVLDVHQQHTVARDI